MGIIDTALHDSIAREFTQEQIDRLRREYFAKYMGPWADKYTGTPAHETYGETRRPKLVRMDPAQPSSNPIAPCQSCAKLGPEGWPCPACSPGSPGSPGSWCRSPRVQGLQHHDPSDPSDPSKPREAGA